MKMLKGKTDIMTEKVCIQKKHKGQYSQKLKVKTRKYVKYNHKKCKISKINVNKYSLS